MRPEKKLPIELFAQYSESDLRILETNLNHQPEGELSVQLALQEDENQEDENNANVEKENLDQNATQLAPL